MATPKKIRLTSSFPAADTGKPMVYEFDTSDPAQMAEYSAIKKEWDAEGARYKASQRNVFRTKPGSPEEMQLGLQQERNLREMRRGAPQAGAAVGEGVGTYVGALTGNPAIAKNLGTAGAWLGGGGFRGTLPGGPIGRSGQGKQNAQRCQRGAREPGLELGG